MSQNAQAIIQVFANYKYKMQSTKKKLTVKFALCSW